MTDEARYQIDVDCVAVLGPTAVGKSSVACSLAQRYQTCVISADSMQIYRGMDIGTAKLPVCDRSVVHYGIDLISPQESFSAMRFQAYAREIIDRYRALGKPSIICGGTGLYLRSVLEDFHFAPGDQEGNELRDTFEQYAKRYGAEALHRLLSAKDPRAAELIHPHNVRRVVRALELCELNESYADYAASFEENRPIYRQQLIGLTMRRDLLYERINQRVDQMFEEGLLDEVRSLYRAGSLINTAAQAIGYKELIAYLNGTVSFEDAVAKIKQASRRYAKRQLTWFRRYPQIVWFDVEAYDSHDDLVAAICDTLETNNLKTDAKEVL